MVQKYLVTPALPYANGAPHLGHLVEHIQVNVFVRALRMAGEDVLYVCGADAHGTPIEINAKKAGVTPEAFAQKWQQAFDECFKQYEIEFDGGFGSTHTELNEKHAQIIFKKAQDGGFITTSDVEQLYDIKNKRFLPDRLIKGTCPKCKSPDQYGDSCEKCGSTYRPTDLIDPKSALSQETPVLKTSKHYFFTLNQFAIKLNDWAEQPNAVHEDVRRYLSGWFKDGLKDWDISRDGPYFGFRIPGETDKYFYVWLDAPIGYISLTEKAALEKGRTVEDYWQDKNTRIIHFIGKDIIYFHTLFWPAVLMAANYTLPETIAVHGMLTVNGEKMSKSRGTFILADQFAKYFDPQTLRYYLSCKLSPRIEDIDLSFTDFINRVNSDLVNKIINLISRTVPLLHRHFQGKVSAMDPQAKTLIKDIKKLAHGIEELYRNRDTAQVVRDVVAIADLANRYLQDNAPWDSNKNTPEQTQQQLTTALWAGKVCLALLKPILPTVAEQTEKMLKLKTFTFDNLLEPLEVNLAILPYTRLLERLDMKKVTNMTEANQSAISTTTAPTNVEKIDSNLINIDEFMKVDLRAALVLEAKTVE
ncbi:MAG: methionine--tRNA ligase, partial [bacterium]|nr:methionine--tRNA ligase [bacterium]